jgi:hypothetical protein
MQRCNQWVAGAQNAFTLTTPVLFSVGFGFLRLEVSAFWLTLFSIRRHSLWVGGWMDAKDVAVKLV